MSHLLFYYSNVSACFLPQLICNLHFLLPFFYIPQDFKFHSCHIAVYGFISNAKYLDHYNGMVFHLCLLCYYVIHFNCTFCTPKDIITIIITQNIHLDRSIYLPPSLLFIPFNIFMFLRSLSSCLKHLLYYPFWWSLPLSFATMNLFFF